MSASLCVCVYAETMQREESGGGEEEMGKQRK